MKKKITAILCAACMLCAMLPLSVSAAGNLEGVDYTRITSGTGYQVKLTLGDLEFWGDLSRGSSLSENEQDKIIRQVMVDQKVTSGMLINAPSIIAQAEMVEGFSMKDATNAILKLTGAGDLLDLYDIIMGSSKPPTVGETIRDMAIDKLKDQSEEILEDAMTKGGKIALRGGGKFALKVFFLLPDLTEIGLDALTKYENLQAVFALALEKKTMLERFYDECNKRIAQVSGDGGEWRISFAGPRGQGVTAVHNFNMWGIGGLMADWTLTGELVRQITGADDNYGGTYQGTLTLCIEGVDMENSFDARFKELKKKYPAEDTSYWSLIGISSSVDDYKTTVLKRTASGNLTVYINEGSGEITPTISGILINAGDNTEFLFDHNINGSGTFAVAKVTRSLLYKSGDIGSYTVTKMGFQTTIAGTVPSEDNGETIQVEMDIGTVWKPLDSEPIITVYIN